jgi:hypothetical protein
MRRAAWGLKKESPDGVGRRRAGLGTRDRAMPSAQDFSATKENHMPQFDATIKHIKDGVKGFTIAAAVKNIEGWETTLEKHEEPGVKAILRDLGSLKKHLQADEPKGDAILKLVAKLGKETVTLAGKADGKNAEKVKALGEALVKAGEEHGADKAA